jgi:hypothetical protein
VPQNSLKKAIVVNRYDSKKYSNTIHLIQSINPEVKIIITVSPVRHIKDGFVENQLASPI